MRALVFLLIFANLLFFVWTQGYFGSSASPDAMRIQQQLLADQISIVARGEPPATVKTTSAEPVVASSCLEWADLSVADAERLESMLAEKFPAFNAARRTVPVHASYWVFIPPSANKQLADKKAAELKKLGAPEIFVVPDAGPNQLAISLGVFSSEEAAKQRLEELRAIGVKSARVGERNGKPALTALAANGPAAQGDALREAVVALLPESKPVVCKGTAQ